MSKRPIKIAMAQSQISADVRENGREMRKLMRRARAGGAAIALFPEGALSGCSKAQIKARDRVDWDALVVDELSCARRSDDTDAPSGVTSGPMAAGSVVMPRHLVRC